MAHVIDPHGSFLDELDARQDDLLAQLDQLNMRLESLLSQFGTHPAPPPPQTLGEAYVLPPAEAGVRSFAPIQVARFPDGTEQAQPQ